MRDVRSCCAGTGMTLVASVGGDHGDVELGAVSAGGYTWSLDWYSATSVDGERDPTERSGKTVRTDMTVPCG